MRRHLFVRIMGEVTTSDPWFTCHLDATSEMGMSLIQKCVAALCILAYGSLIDVVDEYTCISECIVTEILNKLCATVVNVFEHHYLIHPNLSKVTALLAFNVSHGFLGMLGSIDYMHWEW
jgi:hypothetical protein